MSITSAKAHPPLFAPIVDLRAAGFRTSLFQGCAYGVDPKTGTGYLFQLQAFRDRVGLEGDEEDLRIHRFVQGSVDRKLVYRDTMVVLKGGHVQSAHVRISQAGTPYLWLGLERYDSHHAQQGADLYRVKYQPGKSIPRSGAAGVQRVYTGEGTVMAVGCPDWTIVLRRPGAKGDVYEWHREKTLLDATTQRKARNGIRPLPRAFVTVPKLAADDNYQSSLAQGKYDDPKRIYRASGGSQVLISCTSPVGDHGGNAGPWTDRVDLTVQARAALSTAKDPEPNTEPEGMVTIGGLLHVCVQTGSVSQRRLAYFPLSW